MLIRLLLLTHLLLIVGCDDGAQRVQVAISGTRTHGLANDAGSMTIVRGNANPVTAQSKVEPLLYILTLAPSIQGNESGTSESSDAYVTTFKRTWKTPRGDLSAELSWDRRTDIVSAANTTFDRKRGNVFVLAITPQGKFVANQHGPIDVGLDEFAALPKIQATLPTDSPAKTVALLPKELE
jgi:hypothetical protein